MVLVLWSIFYVYLIVLAPSKGNLIFIHVSYLVFTFIHIHSLKDKIVDKNESKPIT